MHDSYVEINIKAAAFVILNKNTFLHVKKNWKKKNTTKKTKPNSKINLNSKCSTSCEGYADVAIKFSSVQVKIKVGDTHLCSMKRA